MKPRPSFRLKLGIDPLPLLGSEPHKPGPKLVVEFEDKDQHAASELPANVRNWYAFGLLNGKQTHG
jgi:hypothetical protein